VTAGGRTFDVIAPYGGGTFVVVFLVVAALMALVWFRRR